MIKRYLPFLMIVATLISSCSTEENDIVNAEVEGVNESLLQSHKISRDASGKYTIDYTLAKNAQANLVKDDATQTTNLHAFESKNALSYKTTSNISDIELQNNKIKLGVFENGEERNSITVEDENIILAKGEVNINFLQTYSVESFGDDQFVLDFTVREGIQVDFKYNSDENIYEVHLKEGPSNGTAFTKLYKKAEHLPLKIDFVNYIKVVSDNDNLKGKSIAYVERKIPRYGQGE
ncbi:hypothetical protein ACSIGC_13450 [Tenacibaculum sp. ZS6-P6]|uniref:hypothetical protein n=1 Tax=Tenacibaculum sp. ZS6-P6 TaxID=3447503 RepID=UPI003F9E12CD